MSRHRKGDKDNRGQGGATPNADKIRWRLEWHENGGPVSEPFNSHMALDDKIADLKKRGLAYHVVNV